MSSYIFDNREENSKNHRAYALYLPLSSYIPPVWQYRRSSRALSIVKLAALPERSEAQPAHIALMHGTLMSVLCGVGAFSNLILTIPI
jgi:hypothetical protein